MTGSEPPAWRRAATEWRDLRSQADGLHIGVASSFTANSLEPQLGASLVRQGWETPKITVGEYNQIHQACLSPATQFGEAPDIVVVLLRLEDVFERDIWDYIAGNESAGDAAVDGTREIAALASKLAEQGIRVVVSLPPTPLPVGVDGFDSRLTARLGMLGSRARAAILEETDQTNGLSLIDLGGLTDELGRQASGDDRKWLLYKQPFSEAFFHTLGAELARGLAQQTRSYPKCIAVDCDNTLWGGVIGEDGIGGIELGTDFPGSAFQHFQRQLLLLKNAGVLLVAVSKNDEPAVLEVFDNHPGMVLSRSDIAAWRVNWVPKSENLRSLSTELNFGLDAFVFIDDSDFEVAEVRNALPEVTVLQVPEEPSDIVRLLSESALFRNIEATADDGERTKRVQQEAKRRATGDSLSQEDFLASLQLQVAVCPAKAEDLGRVTQLMNKTNQFNLTTVRRDQAAVAALAASESHHLLTVSVEDRFGEYGLVGVIVVDQTSNDAAEIDTLLLSCRVLGRGVEFAVLSGIERYLGADRSPLWGRYLPTLKNGQVADFYERAGFERIDDERFRLATSSGLTSPPHIELTVG